MDTELGKQLPLWSLAPFVLLLLAIALIPLHPKGERWWHRSNKNKAIVALVCGLPPFAAFLLMEPHVVVHTGLEYFQFIVLISSLFVVSGGVYVSGDIRATPFVNTLFLVMGAALANVVGTTGAAMLLIRPLLRTNSQRKNKRHIPVFFIFLVANIGGCLLPIGDPPLFLGFLKGVPFFWTTDLFFPWLLAVGIVASIFFVFDKLAYSGESKEALRADCANTEPLKLHGRKNIPLLVAIVLAVGSLESVQLPAANWHEYVPFRELIMIGVAAISLIVTPISWENYKRRDQLRHTRMAVLFVIAVATFYAAAKMQSWWQLAMLPVAFAALTIPCLSRIDRKVHPREENKFTFGPVNEVAILFAGIFAAMMPALLILRARGSELPVRDAWQYFFFTGTLSSFLDNAPTYLTFFSIAQGQGYGGADAVAGIAPGILQGISLGAVFMGAMSYIGNAPNFMVKSVTEESGLKMPSFGGYLMWAVCILLPVFFLINIVFLGFPTR